ncbi:MAG: methionine--tRNA ligase [Chlamydiales bacterium]|nr:methionine--tRNA ligase [Chlamydiales bacterium]
MKERVLITSALPYANGPLHFGHIAGAYLPADCYARFQRLVGNDVLFVCGSDEYGVAISMSAELAGRTPKEHVAIFHEINKSLFEKLQISFNHFSRTTWDAHKISTVQYFQDLLANGYIEERITNQLYSEKDQKFLADRYVVGTCPRCGYEEARGDECQKCAASYDATDLKNPRSKLTNAPLVLKQTKHWFLLLDKFQDKVNAWLDTKKWKANVLQFAKNYSEKLHPRAITRDSNWGIPVPLPDADGKVLYVWFDAPIGYISASMDWAEHSGDRDKWKEYWCNPDTKLVQFIGKDNIPFHAVIFPAMTMGQNKPYKLVDELPANEFYNLEGRQFSKSEGWYIDLEDFFSKYSVDQIRYTIAANAPENADSEFTWKDFQSRSNAELLGKYGNFANRVLVFAKTHLASCVPKLEAPLEIDLKFLADMQELALEAYESFNHFKVRRSAQIVMEMAQLGNIYFDAKKPWQEAKLEDKNKVNLTIACCIECLKTLALISWPIIPGTAEKLWKMLGYKKPLLELGWQQVVGERAPVAQLLLEPEILFKKIEDSQIAEEVKALQERSAKQNVDVAKEAKTYAPLKVAIDIDLFGQIDLRVGLILEATPVPKSKKLLQLKVDLGFEVRTIVSGISNFYKGEEIIGKKVIVVANLKPVTLMGVESHGMILAASHDKKLELATILEMVPGSIIN